MLRGARPDEPELPTGRIVLEPPPRLQPHEGAGGVLVNAIPMLGSLGSVALVATMGRAGGGRALIAGGLFLFSTLGFVLVQIDRQRRQRTHQVAGPRTGYLRYLAGVRRAARVAADAQRRALTWHHPDPTALPALADQASRVWARDLADPRFLHVRYGRCDQPLALDLVPPEHTTTDEADPVAVSALHRLLGVHRLQPELPAWLDLRSVDRVEVCGPAEPARALARALICSATTSHSPDHLAIAVLTSEQHLAHWDWVKWLPHARSDRRSDAAGPARMVATSLPDLAGLLPRDLAAAPHLLMVVDGAEPPSGDPDVPLDERAGVTVLDLPTRWGDLDDATGLRIRLADEPTGGGAGDTPRPAVLRRHREEPVRARADQCSLATAEALARRLAPLRPVSPGGAGRPAGGPTRTAGPLELLGLDRVHTYDPESAWRGRPARDRLRVPIGVGDDGSVVHLDLKESAQHGMGPHGLVVGATGSGKSELLRTLVLGLALTHSPEQLNLVLVDFKGGATFAGMAPLPHVSAIITNLAQELTLVDRMQDALSGELVRRQELLRAAGNFASIRDYEGARAAGANLAPMPSLLVVVDEFSELLAAKPEFIDLFVAIGRLGRSLGLHLLLASQRLDDGRLRGLESHLSYRIGLRTFSAAESRTVLGAPDAYELPAEPGLGLLRPDPATLQRFQAAYVSGPPRRTARIPPEDDGPVPGILPFTITEVSALDASAPAAVVRRSAEPPGDQESLLDVAVRRMANRGPAAHQVWLPPLDVPDPLDGLMTDLVADPALGLVSPHWRGRGGLVVPLGAVDRPREQRRDTLTVDLGGSGGHAAVVGGPRSGKSTLLRTMVASLSLTTTPLESQFFVLDFGGGTFAPFARLPHVAGIGSRSEPDVVRRIVAEVRGVVDRREEYFRARGIDSIETYRSLRAAGRADDGYGDVFVVVDGWSTLRADFDDLEIELQQLAGRGLTFGLHLLVGATRWADFRAATRDLLGTRLELRLGDPLDSEVDRSTAARVPAGRPGRGLLPSRHHFIAALPRIDGSADVDGLGDGVTDLVDRVAAAWTGPAAPRLRLLPDLVTLEEVREVSGPAADGRRLLLGLGEGDLAPVGLDVDAEPHLLLFGDGRSGKSAALRAYAREVMRTRNAQEAQLVVVDYRRSLLGEVPEDYLVDYLTSATQAQPALRDLAAYLQSRLPGPGVTAEQLRHRSWWSGAEVFVLVDDYDLVATQQGSPVQVLQPLLAQARDVGLHLVVARRSGGASRALYEPVVQSLRDLATPGLLLSGSPDEGPLLSGQKPQPAPPGRGRLVTRDRGVEVVQLAWCEQRQ
ncbi:type VII secretion protein EccCa [Nocardioides sp. T2.26MG-1]|uniref:type VII secretion protein EccCa n=1 Tax=Nocardioides sp. T2.26MG-1 TaxID=3041166 RepID=UPI0024779D8F|nr:type VII secretion protein EccCa [Nocardioides sp. T2.26MG-1]CAI9401217.1 ESX secretion system protein EccC [Nocardioides sp. T2.26MG-1]